MKKTKKVDEILRIIGAEENLGDDSGRSREAKLTGRKIPAEKSEGKKLEKKKNIFISTSSRPQEKKKIATITTRNLPAFLPNYHIKKESKNG